MEATAEDLNLLNKIIPPRIDDAGLEDCALPPHSIQEAFLKAASAVGSRASSIFSEDTGGCVTDPWREKSVQSDSLLGIESENAPSEPCAVGKGVPSGREGESGSDVVVVGDRNEEDIEKKDEVLVVGYGEEGGDGKDCVDGLKGLKIKEKEEKCDEEDDDDEDEKKKPTLIEGYFLNP
ncbi:uncharacterized protein LOC130813919 [Amaranthus tricolor]|uniref:uncharacterized protein LOC130813919 n=1 Tax=Amaranthus tricolor TaxID=29722 RepID=UPI00258B7463|nr:uncharacterized protein LOC130813919 [Amaranthus tricolor]